ncbi:hypothetical protein [Nitrosopumilus sp. b1]|uniref:hypothetical protein n=1 Tax=Nitrosopumilus sp. b1 TaxID=2109907 RepID=UPI0015F44DB3|nr:hypothetical protein [Nitrosopumilus sp. b1]
MAFAIIGIFSISFLSVSYAEEISIQEWDIPTPNSSPHDVVVSQDGTVWFTEIATNKIAVPMIANLYCNFIFYSPCSFMH